MTGQEALNILMFRLGKRTDADLRAQLLIELNEAKRRLEQTPSRPPMLIDSASLTTVASQDWLALPDGFLGEIEDEQPYYTTSDGRVYLSRSTRSGQQIAYGTETGGPRTYCVQEKVFFGPIPDAAYSISWRYYKAQAAIADSSTENTWLTNFGDLLVGKVGVVACGTLVLAPEAMPVFQSMLDAGAARYKQSILDWEEQNLDRRMGGEEA